MKERQKKKDERVAREVAADQRAADTGVVRKKGRGRSDFGGYVFTVFVCLVFVWFGLLALGCWIVL